MEFGKQILLAWLACFVDNWVTCWYYVGIYSGLRRWKEAQAGNVMSWVEWLPNCAYAKEIVAWESNYFAPHTRQAAKSTQKYFHYSFQLAMDAFPTIPGLCKDAFLGSQNRANPCKWFTWWMASAHLNTILCFSEEIIEIMSATNLNHNSQCHNCSPGNIILAENQCRYNLALQRRANEGGNRNPEFSRPPRHSTRTSYL